MVSTTPRKIARKPVRKVPSATILNNDESLHKIIDVVNQLSFKLDNVLHTLCILLEKSEKTLCVACHGTGTNDALETAWKTGHATTADPKCPKCDGKGFIND